MPVIPTFKQYWNLTEKSIILDVGCAKGFMIHDLAESIQGITVRGIDISQYAIDNVIEDMRPNVQVSNAISLPFESDFFDVVISINTIHNLEQDECAVALQEIQRVSKKHSFITVDAYRNEDEKKRMYDWNLTAKTIMSTDDWVNFFREVGYTGDYYWFIP
jgi:ubiquinone/menaquinone biosynthesis C-methylase UbiE